MATQDPAQVVLTGSTPLMGVWELLTWRLANPPNSRLPSGRQRARIPVSHHAREGRGGPQKGQRRGFAMKRSAVCCGPAQNAPALGMLR